MIAEIKSKHDGKWIQNNTHTLDEFNGKNNKNHPIKQIEENNGTNTKECMKGLHRLFTLGNNGRDPPNNMKEFMEWQVL